MLHGAGGAAWGKTRERRLPLVLLTSKRGGIEQVERCCLRARQEGVSCGMTLAHARSLLPPRAELLVQAHEPHHDEEALLRLARWALRVAPTVAADAPDGLLIDITGTQRLYRGEPRVVRSVAQGINRLGFAVRVAAASTFACAWAAARYSSDAVTVVPAGQERAWNREYPIAALRIDPATIEGLRELGIVRLGQVLAMPRTPLAARFGPDILARIDRLVGQLDEQIDPIRPREPIRAEMVFDGPSDRWEALELAGRRTLTELLDHLRRHQRGVRRLDVHLARPDRVNEQLTITLSRASANEKHLWSLLRARLEGVDLGGGAPDSTAPTGIEGVTLIASRTAVLRARQAVDGRLGSTDDHAAEASLGEVIDTLVQRLGADRVLRFKDASTHIPEQAVIFESVMSPYPERITPRAGEKLPPPRPARLFEVAQRAAVMALTPDGPVTRLRWHGHDYAVTACVGPEKIEPEWWRWESPPDHDEQPSGRQRTRLRHTPSAMPPARDYFSVQIEGGRWLWVYRAAISEPSTSTSCADGSDHVAPPASSRSAWFVHGEWC
ncbi:MAG: DNA polymerase Y family protein [Phycisphaerales bacterium]|nr:DNA polymerase Y family protein [Phycisphaerales bacterium]